MSLRINNNISALNGHRNLLQNNMAVGKSLERLSSGLRINTAADDAAGLVISEQMRAQLSGLNQAIDNSETAVAMVQTAEGALDEVNSLLTKARELALHAANEGVNDTNQLLADQAELDNVIQSISRISEFTQFGTKKLLDGSLNGTTDLGSGIDRVRVGNLVTNSSVDTGSVQVQVTGSAVESNVAVGGASDSGFVFTTSGVDGMALGAAQIRSGITATLTLQATGGEARTYSYISNSTQTASTIAANFTSLAESDGYAIKYDAANSGFKVSNAEAGDNNFSVDVSFFRGAVSGSAGFTEAYQTNIEATDTGDTSDPKAAAAMFQDTGVADLKDIGATTAVTSGVVFTLTLNTTSGGASSSPVTYTAAASGDTMQSVLNQLQTGIQAVGGFSGATLAFDGTTNEGFSLTLDRGVNGLNDDFSFALEADFDNSPTGEVQIAQVTFGAVGSGVANDGTGVYSGADIEAAFTLLTGNNIKVTIDDQEVIVAVANGDTMTAMAGKLETAIQGLGGDYTSFDVEFASGGTSLTGGVFTGANFVDATGTTAGGTASFLISAGAQRTDQFSISVQIDRAIGTDLDLTTANNANITTTGAAPDASLNIDSTSGAIITSGVTATATQSAKTISSTGTVNINGQDATATMITSDGTSLAMVQSTLTATGGTNLTLDSTKASNSGFLGVELSITSSLAAAGGSTSFTLTEGALFQVGANDGQKVSTTIDSITASELGRGATTALTSLADLSSENGKAALLNGLTEEAIQVIDAAIDEVTTTRGRLGAFQANTLESGLNSLRVSTENLTAAESTIRDVDFARESSEFTRNNILVQSATAMLAQANQMPQNVLQLLG